MSSKPTIETGRDSYGMTPEDRQRLKAKTDGEITAAALADPDARPIPLERLARMVRPVAKAVRQKLRMSREEFAAAYGVPLDVLEAWERGAAEPSRAELAYLRLIEREPEKAKLVSA